MTDACHFLKSENDRWLSLLPIPKMTGACHFFQIQKWQVSVIFVNKNDTYLSFFFTRQNRRWAPHVFRGGAQTHFQTSVTTPEPPMFLEGGLRNKSKMAQIEPNLSPPVQKHGGLRGSYRCLTVGLSPPPKNMGGSAQGFGVWKKMTGICHFWISKNDSQPVISGFQKNDRRLTFLDFAKVTATCHCLASKKNDRRLSSFDILQKA